MKKWRALAALERRQQTHGRGRQRREVDVDLRGADARVDPPRLRLGRRAQFGEADAAAELVARRVLRLCRNRCGWRQGAQRGAGDHDRRARRGAAGWRFATHGEDFVT